MHPELVHAQVADKLPDLIGSLGFGLYPPPLDPSVTLTPQFATTYFEASSLQDTVTLADLLPAVV